MKSKKILSVFNGSFETLLDIVKKIRKYKENKLSKGEPEYHNLKHTLVILELMIKRKK